MGPRNVLLAAAVLVNLVLVTVLMLHLTAPPAAQAQVMGGGSAYASVTARLIMGGEDAIWVMDMKTRKLAVLRCHNLPATGQRIMMFMDSRDVQKDMRGETTK